MAIPIAISAGLNRIKSKFKRNLSFGQWVSIVFLAFMLLLLPLSFIVAVNPVRLFKRAYYPATPPVPPTGAFVLSLSNNQTTLTCRLGDPNCFYQTVLNASNRTGQLLYQTTIYLSSPGNAMSFVGFDGNWTSSPSTTNRTIQPGEAVNTQVKVIPPLAIGTTRATFHIDGKTCNLHTNPPDCYFYGASNFTVVINVVGPLISSPTPTPSVAPWPSVAPSPTATPFPFSTPTIRPRPTVTPTKTMPSPTLAPACYKVGPTILDQSVNQTYTPQKLGAGWGVGEPLKFTPNKKGKLDKVELFISGKGSLQVRVVNNSGRVITNTIDRTINNSSGKWETFDFNLEPLVYKNLNYTVSFRATSGEIYVHRGNYWNWARRIYLKPCLN